MDIESILTATGLPVTYLQWHPRKPPDFPYIVYLNEDSPSFGADNIVYHAFKDVSIELYSDNKDPTSEALVETALTANDIYFEKTEAWIEKERMHQVVYSIQI